MHGWTPQALQQALAWSPRRRRAACRRPRRGGSRRRRRPLRLGSPGGVRAPGGGAALGSAGVSASGLPMNCGLSHKFRARLREIWARFGSSYATPSLIRPPSHRPRPVVAPITWLHSSLFRPTLGSIGLESGLYSENSARLGRLWLDLTLARSRCRCRGAEEALHVASARGSAPGGPGSGEEGTLAPRRRSARRGGGGTRVAPGEQRHHFSERPTCL